MTRHSCVLLCETLPMRWPVCYGCSTVIVGPGRTPADVAHVLGMLYEAGLIGDFRGRHVFSGVDLRGNPAAGDPNEQQGGREH